MALCTGKPRQYVNARKIVLWPTADMNYPNSARRPKRVRLLVTSRIARFAELPGFNSKTYRRKHVENEIAAGLVSG